MRVDTTGAGATEDTFWRALFHYGWRIALFVALATGGTFLASHFLPPKYDATVVAIPVQQELRTQFVEQETGLLGSFSPLQSRTTMAAGKYIERMRSMPFFLLVATKTPIIPALLDEELSEADITIPEEGNSYSEPLWRAYNAFNEITRISTSEETGLMRVTVRWGDAVLAAEWANLIVDTLNNVRRDSDVEVALSRIDYLTGALHDTGVNDVRRLLTERIGNEMQFMTLARALDEYSLEIVARAVPPFFPAFPKPLFMAALAFVASFGLSVLVAPALYHRS